MADQQKNQRGANLTQSDRERGGKVSAAKQERDARGKFAGSKGSVKRTTQQKEDRAEPNNPEENQNKQPSSHHQTGMTPGRYDGKR